MKNLFVTALLSLCGLWSLPASALFGSGNTNVSSNYGCVGLDGVPITNGTLEQQCCSNGQLKSNPPDVCRAGFNTISGDSAGGAAFNMSLAESTLEVAHDLNGSDTDFNNVTAATSKGAGASNSVSAVTSAIQSAGDLSGGYGDSSLSSLAATGKGSGSASASGGGSGSSGSGGDSGGIGSLSGTTGGANSKDGKGGQDGKDPNALDPNSLNGSKFASNDRGGDRDGSGNGFGGFGNGTGDSGTGMSGTGMSEMGFGDEDLTQGSLAGSDIEGTVVDPQNYFSLTNKSDNLFKIVSRRYDKKFHKLAGSAKTNPNRIPAGKSQNNKPL